MDSPSRAKQHVLRQLDAGATGCLHTRLPSGVSLSLYVMLGEVLAVHASDDRERLLRLLANNGSVSPDRIEHLRKHIVEGHSLTEALFEVVPEDTLQDLLQERFRENLFLFLQGSGTSTFEPMESIFVENIQVGHESRQLVEELDQLVLTTARLRQPPGLVLAPGSGTMRHPDHLRVAGLVHPRLPLADLLQRSPWESGRTLGLVAEMLERGSLVAVAATAPARPAAAVRPDATTGPLPLRPAAAQPAAPPQRDAVAAALASAVSAAVAKHGRPKPDVSPNRAPTSPVPAVPAPAAQAAKPSAAEPPVVAVAAPVPVAPAAPAARTPVAPTRPAHPLAPSADDATEEVDELAAFADHDSSREGGDFVAESHLLDRVEVLPVEVLPPPGRKAEPPAPTADEAKQEIFIEMEDAENATKAELANAVALNFAGPKLTDDDARGKLDVLNEVLTTFVAALDAHRGPGMGQSRAQLLVEGTPGAFASLFKGVEVDNTGAVPVEQVLKNLRRRPASEHRRLVNRGVADLIERALSLASEELEDKQLDALLEKIAGYQSRIGM